MTGWRADAAASRRALPIRGACIAKTGKGSMGRTTRKRGTQEIPSVGFCFFAFSVFVGNGNSVAKNQSANYLTSRLADTRIN